MSRALLLDLYELTMAESYLTYKRDNLATFDLFVRQLPENRKYLLACGLEDILNYIENLSFSAGDIDYLRGKKVFSEVFLRYLKNFRFRGDIWAIPEGTVFFAQEPVIRVTASIIESQIIESFLLNTINLQTMIASKASRIVSVSCGRDVFDFSLRRTHGPEAGIKVARSSYIAGCCGTSNVLAGKLYGIPIAGTMAHSYIMSFKNEMESFLAYSNSFPDKTVLLVDTYETKKGIENAVAIGLYLKEKKHRLLGIRLDSGDIVKLSKLARSILNKAGLSYVKIFASGNLDEFKIKKLIDKGACLDSFGVGTNMGTSSDAPSLDVVYKISEISGINGEFFPTMKLSRGKITYPGRKQVFRIMSKDGKFIKDILGLEGEKIKGFPLLVKVVDKSKVLYQSCPLEKIRLFAKGNLSRFPGKLREVYPQSKYEYPVMISPELERLRLSLSSQLRKRQ